MSEAKHTSEPWDIVQFGAYFDEEETDYRCCLLHRFENGAEYVAEVRFGKVKELAEANARRIVAAVNDCKGIPTEALEAGAVAELLEACHNIAAKAARVIERWESGDLAGAVRELNYARQSARAAIAKATGEKYPTPS